MVPCATDNWRSASRLRPLLMDLIQNPAVAGVVRASEDQLWSKLMSFLQRAGADDAQQMFKGQLGGIPDQT